MKNKTDEKEEKIQFVKNDIFSLIDLAKQQIKEEKLKKANKCISEIAKEIPALDKQQQKIKELEKEIEQFKVIIVRHEQENMKLEKQNKALKKKNEELRRK